MALGMILGMGSTAQGQATTGATPTYNPGPTLPKIDGNFQYSLFASETAETGFTNDVNASTNLGGTAIYMTNSTMAPFSLAYSGGYVMTTEPSFSSSTFQGLTVSQGLVGGGWAMGVTDSVSFLPSAPTGGFSGVPGSGDIGVPPISGGTIPTQTVLTGYSRRVSNSVGGNVERSLNPRTSISGSGSYGILRFFNGEGENSDQITGSLSLNRRLNARNTLSGSGYYSTYSFSGVGAQPTVVSEGLNIVYERLWTRALTTSISAGPQWIGGYTLTPLQLQNYPPGINPVIPGRVTTAVNASVSYTRGRTVGSLTYSRGINAGSGVYQGASGDTISGQVARTFGPDWAGSASGTLARTIGLVGGSATKTLSFGGQVTRRITRHLSGFLSDVVQTQSVGNLAGTNAFNGTSNSVSIGISYSPRTTRLGQF